jgi:hypothetical protein
MSKDSLVTANKRDMGHFNPLDEQDEDNFDDLI